MNTSLIVFFFALSVFSINVLAVTNIAEINMTKQNVTSNIKELDIFISNWVLLLNRKSTSILFKKTITNSKYKLEIGNHYYAGLLSIAMKKRLLWMGKGQHLLRSLTYKIQNNNLQIKLIIDWQGLNNKGKPSIAKIEQIIDLKNNNKNYQMLEVKEQHLMPNFGSWGKMLC
jgi:hypothetical protein